MRQLAYGIAAFSSVALTACAPMEQIVYQPTSLTPAVVDFAKSNPNKCGAIVPGSRATYPDGVIVETHLQKADAAPHGTFMVYAFLMVGSAQGHIAEPMDKTISYSLDHGEYRTLAPAPNAQWTVYTGSGRHDVIPDQANPRLEPIAQWDSAVFDIVGALPLPETIDLKLPLKSDDKPVTIEIEFDQISSSYQSPLNGC